MKRRNIQIVLLMAVLGLAASSCSISTQTMKSPNYQIEFYKTDFEYSPMVSSEATVVRVFGVNWKKLFNRENGNRIACPIVSGLKPVTPVLGDSGKGKASEYALYTLVLENPGYDVVVQPRYKRKRFMVPLIYSKRTVEVTARLGKIKDKEE